MDPRHFIDRERERERLWEQTQRFVTQPQLGTPRGDVLAVVGGKGVGKSILTREVLLRVRSEHSSHAVIIQVDCRRRRSWREVLSDLCTQLRDELEQLTELSQPVPAYALDGARVLREIAQFDRVERSQLWQHTVSHTRSGSLKMALQLRRAFSSELQMQLTDKKVDQSQLVGSVVLDEDRLHRMVTALLTDLAGDGWRVLIFLDNIDELDHRYDTEDERRHVRQEVEGVLKLHEAPVLLVLNMRTYFAGPFNRLWQAPVRLGPLDDERLMEMLAQRMCNEPEEVLRGFQEPELQAELRWMASCSSTPFELLRWVQERASEGLMSAADRDQALDVLLETSFPNVDPAELRQLVGAFPRPEARVSREQLLKAVAGNEWLLSAAVRYQAVLPVDFWSPEVLTLDPRLHPVHHCLNAEG